MQNTSATYKEIVAGIHWFETKLVIGDEFYLIDENADYITFGGTRIYYDSDSGGYGGNMIKEIKTTQHLFTDDKPMVGCCVAAEIDVTMVKPTATIKRMSSIKPFIRAVNDTKESEWIPKGVFYIDTRSDGESTDEIVFHGYDAMLKAENDFPVNGGIGEWPKTDIDVVSLIAGGGGSFLDLCFAGDGGLAGAYAAAYELDYAEYDSAKQQYAAKYHGQKLYVEAAPPAAGGRALPGGGGARSSA